MNVQFGVYVFDVHPDGFDAQRELASDFLVGGPSGQQFQYLLLARRESRSVRDIPSYLVEIPDDFARDAR